MSAGIEVSSRGRSKVDLDDVCVYLRDLESAYEARIEELEADVKRLEADVEEKDAKLESLEEKVGKLEDEIQDLESRLEPEPEVGYRD